MSKPPPDDGRATLLIVDDDEMQRLLCRESLGDEFDIVEANEGKTAIAAFSQAKPDLVLLDVMMPDIDGFETCRVLRSLPGGGTTPIVMATGLNDLASIESAYGAGATDFVSKPINFAALPYRIRYLLRSRDVLRNFILSERWLAEAQRIAGVGNFNWSPPSPAARLSAEAARIFGYGGAKGPIPVRALLRRILAVDRAQVIRALREVKSGRVIDIDHRIALPDGQIRHISLRAELGGEAGEPSSIHGTCHDITERKRIEMELREARDEAQRSDAAKTAFLATMSHELKTPLNGIIGFAELLGQASDRVPDDKHLEFTRCILNAGHRMYQSVDNVLMMAKLESGGYRLRREVYDLSALVRSAVAAFRDSAESMNRAVSVETAENSMAVSVDARSVGRMLRHLLSNSVKYSAAQTPINVRVDRAADGHCRVSVEDRGVGMDAAQAAMAVNPFRQLDDGLAREFEGMGLGLSITKRLIEAHGGELEIVSAPKRGTRVILNFPVSGPPRKNTAYKSLHAVA
jgi:signal transduction histidine kinase